MVIGVFPLSLSFCLPFRHDSFGFCGSVGSAFVFRFTLFFIEIFRDDHLMLLGFALLDLSYCMVVVS
jgi:hypothetical protein